jgi:hypothetical protein
MKSFVIVLILIFNLSNSLIAQNVELKMILTDKDGLPQNKVKNLVFDEYKYIWIGTQNGITKYNGYSFKNYPEIFGKEITSLFLDESNNIWIGTPNGLYKLDRVSDKLILVAEGYIRDITQNNQYIYFITIDSIFCLNKEKQLRQIHKHAKFDDLRKIIFYKNYLYVGFGKNNGLKKFKLKENKILLIKNVVDNSVINCLKVINQNLWIGTSTGKLYVQRENYLDSIPLKNKNAIQAITLIKDEVWIGTDGNGIFAVNNNNNYPIKHYLDVPNKKNEIGSNSIHSILTTNNNEVWVGTNDSGISYFSDSQNNFLNLSKLYESAFKHLSKTATVCFEDMNKNLFFGTSFGLSKINPISNKSYSIGLTQSSTQIGGSKILSIFESEDKNIWVSAYDGGLGKFNKDLKFKKSFYPFPNGSKNRQAINFISQHSKNKILVNSMLYGLGIFDVTNEKMIKTPFISSDTLINYQTQAIRKFNDEIYVYVFGKGICFLDKKENVLKILFKPPVPVNDLYKNNDGTFWLATRGSGLFLVNNKGVVLKSLNTNDGISSNFSLRIEKDDFNTLWVSSISGLTKIESTDQISTFDHRNGLPSREFKPFASTKLRNGKIIFGTLQGFVLINPKEQNLTLKLPKVIISDLKFQNKSIKILEDEILLKKPIEDFSEIKIPFNRNSFSIHFFNDDYNLPKSSKYKYRMLGLEEHWINLNENTQASYTNLSSGRYTFQVLSTNKNNNWSKTPTELNIEILSPWYWSKYTIPIYVTLVLLTFYFIYRLIIYRAGVKSERKFSAYKLKMIKVLNENKIDFFTNIAHDIKTPLSLITAPLDLLLDDKKVEKGNRENLSIIKKNTNRLLQLVNDVLDFRTIDTNHKLKLEVSKVETIIFMEDIYDSFNKTCLKKGIELKIVNNGPTQIYIDNNKVKRILWNLISNSMDYSPKGSTLKVSCSIKGDLEPKLTFSIIDRGKGLNKKELKHMFDPYFKGRDLKSNSNRGTGLGLSIVKKLIDVHRGDIKIDSEVRKGTTFSVALPYNQKDYEKKELIHLNLENINYSNVPQEIIEKTVKSKYNLPTLFVVEDNLELNEFLKNLLKSDYKIHSFFNGEDAFHAAKKKTPDIIISDILMPVMDGYSLCKKIKEDFSTSHIPLILLTANSSVDQQVEGMQKGADLYLTKPFKPKLLLASINSTLNNRNKLRKKHQQTNMVKNDDHILTNRDKEFLDNLQKFAQENIEKEKLSITIICENLNCSKSVLIRKTKALTGLTPMAYLNTYKLNIAYKLIMNEGLNVSEASYRVGFSDPNYFTTSFKKQFGKNPSKLSP